MDNLPLDEALCVFGGPDCSFEEMMQFVAAQKHHQFVVGGLMFVLPHRLTENTRPASSLIEDQVVIIGRRDSRSPIVQAYSTILRPFKFETWMMLLGIFLLFLLVRIIIAVYFARPRKRHVIVRHLLGEYDVRDNQLPLTQNEETLRLLNKTAVMSLTLAVSAFFVIVILFYEIAVVNFIFLKKTHALQKEFANLTPEEMKQYVIIKGGGTEVIWRSYVDPEKKYENRTTPWHFCSGVDDW